MIDVHGEDFLAALALTPRIANQIWHKLPQKYRAMTTPATRGVDIEDLISAGKMGLMLAVEKYKPEEHNDTPFKFYANRLIEGAIRDQIKRDLRFMDRNAPDEEAPEVPPIVPCQEKLLTWRHDLHVLLAKMEPDEAFAVVSRLQGMEFSEIGAALKISGTAVCQKVWKAIGLDPKWPWVIGGDSNAGND